ncbi:MAG: nucleotide sugar dehydrogenase [Rhodospirillales bacterium]
MTGGTEVTEPELEEDIAVLGLGYVGLPVALAFARVARSVVGFDSDPARIAALRSGDDWTGEVSEEELRESRLAVSDRAADLAGASLFVICVPTPVDAEKQPDLEPLRQACRTVAEVLAPGGLIVVESTVFPGATEEVCGPLLEALSGLRQGLDFHLGYSPERINPGDREHSLERVVKIVAADRPASLDRLARAYGAIVPAGLHRAPTIKVAEAAKVIENTQRDLNIALMNELSLIFDRLDISTNDVLAAAATKWNFHRFRPGLVGGHCIGVDPYYLTSRALQAGYQPEVILAGRRINDDMGRLVARRAVQLLARAGRTMTTARVGVLGLTFKEDVPDLRNSQVVQLVAELRAFGISPLLHDPLAPPDLAAVAFDAALQPFEALQDLDALVLAVPHRSYLELGGEGLLARLRTDAVMIDIKSALPGLAGRPDLSYWAL